MILELKSGETPSVEVETVDVNTEYVPSEGYWVIRSPYGEVRLWAEGPTASLDRHECIRSGQPAYRFSALFVHPLDFVYFVLVGQSRPPGADVMELLDPDALWDRMRAEGIAAMTYYEVTMVNN